MDVAATAFERLTRYDLERSGALSAQKSLDHLLVSARLARFQIEPDVIPASEFEELQSELDDDAAFRSCKQNEVLEIGAERLGNAFCASQLTGSTLGKRIALRGSRWAGLSRSHVLAGRGHAP